MQGSRFMQWITLRAIVCTAFVKNIQPKVLISEPYSMVHFVSSTILISWRQEELSSSMLPSLELPNMEGALLHGLEANPKGCISKALVTHAKKRKHWHALEGYHQTHPNLTLLTVQLHNACTNYFAWYGGVKTMQLSRDYAKPAQN